MRTRLSQIALLASLVGLAASLASLVDVLGPAPTFCAESGCATVRLSAWSHPLGIPMPVVGVAFFAIMIALAFVARPRVRIALAIAGGAAALGLIGVQAFAIGAWCKLCMIVDPSAIVLAIAVVSGARTVRFSWPRIALVAVPALGALGFAIAIAAGSHAAPASRAPVAMAHEAGVTTVVEYVDFECPFCRALAPRLAEAIAHAPHPVKVVHKMVPLAMHPHAMTAALAWCCADAQGRGDAMADALFAAPVGDLTPEGCEALAARVGCDLARYRTALADPATRARVVADLADARAAHATALPTVDISGTRFAGSNHTADELRAAM